MTGDSFDIKQDQLEKLKQLFPETVTEGKIDWEKLQATLGKDNFEIQNERYVLNWAGKAEAFKVLQQSTTATLKPVPEESINFDNTKNVFIEGENLEVLKVLQKSYYSKIKCIIIDPPYNTGNDSFIYPDSFKENKEEYLKRIGEKDEEGYLLKEGMFRKNSKDNGHYHSNWLSMMYPRLFLAKNLLRDDGVIFIHIDDNEVHNLRMVMNEIYGEENFVANVIWEKKFAPSNDAKWFSDNHDHILIYSKNKEAFRPNLLERNEEALNRYKNPDNDPRGVWVSGDLTVKTYNERYDFPILTPSGKIISPPKGICWRFSKEKITKLISDNKVWFGEKGENVPRLKRFLSDVKEGITPLTIWYHKDVAHNQEAAQELRKLFEGELYFETPKPVRLIKRICHIASKEDDTILDFFAGSATTGHAVFELNKEDWGNRKFLLVQLPELCDKNSEAYKANYKTIADISKGRISRVIHNFEKEIIEATQENNICKTEVFSLHVDLAKLKKEKPELNFENVNQSKEVRTICQAVENLEKKIERNDELINRINNCDLGFKTFKLSSSNFKIWRGNDITEENLETQLDAFTNPVKEGSEIENMLYELILKAGYLLTDKVSPLERGLRGVFLIANGELIIALEEMSQKILDSIISAKPKKVITLDKLFAGNDQLKTNAVLQMRDAEIDFKTI